MLTGWVTRRTDMQGACCPSNPKPWPWAHAGIRARCNREVDPQVPHHSTFAQPNSQRVRPAALPRDGSIPGQLPSCQAAACGVPRYVVTCYIPSSEQAAPCKHTVHASCMTCHTIPTMPAFPSFLQLTCWLMFRELSSFIVCSVDCMPICACFKVDAIFERVPLPPTHPCGHKG